MVVVVIPTYNEIENIPEIVERIISLNLDIFVLVVDDNSPDGTGDMVTKLSKRYNNLRLILRNTKGGRGSACICGFGEALNMDCKFIVEMDADLSHDPSELPLLIENCEKADVVIGSRYLPKSKIINWGLERRIFSKLANYFAFLILQIPIRDYTNGYRCYKKETLGKIDLHKISNTGYIVLSELAYYLYKRGCSFREVPTIFINRKRGKSNVSIGEIILAFWGILKIKLSYRSPV